jgi:hypothetical protein
VDNLKNYVLCVEGKQGWMCLGNKHLCRAF